MEKWVASVQNLSDFYEILNILTLRSEQYPSYETIYNLELQNQPNVQKMLKKKSVSHFLNK